MESTKDLQKLYPLCYKDSTVNAIDYNAFGFGNFLTSEAINFYFEYLMDGIADKNLALLMNPSCYQVLLFEDDFEDLKDSMKRVPLKDYKYLMIPINDSTDFSTPGAGTHWSLLFFDSQTKEFIYFDSTRGFLKNAQRVSNKILALIMNDEKYLKAQINIKICKKSPKQNNDYDCGMYTIAVAEALFDLAKNGAIINGEHVTNENRVQSIIQAGNKFEEKITPQYITQLRQDIQKLIRELLQQKLLLQK